MSERAWLIDVYETTLTIEFSVIWDEFGRISGVAPDALRHAADTDIESCRITGCWFW